MKAERRVDPEKAAKRRAPALAKMPYEDVRWQDFSEIIDSAEPWEQIEHPDNFEWSLIKNVPLSLFPEATVSAISNVDDADEREEHRLRVNEIKRLIKTGKPVWPVIVDSDSGAIVDGWHRLAALHSLKRESVDVLYV